MSDPERDITRTEFAAIIVRGLGLKLENGASEFSDVKAENWYSGAINTAYAYHLIHVALAIYEKPRKLLDDRMKP